jgi:Leucine-rich repeat (LRR) protein
MPMVLDGGMKKLLAAMFVALLMVGCGGAKNDEDSNADNDSASAPFVDKWAEWEANPKPFGGLKTLAKIKKAKESGATTLDLYKNQFGLTKLERLDLSGNEITDVSPLAGLTNLESLWLDENQISDLSPLKGLTNLKYLYLENNQISDLSPLAGLTLTELSLFANEITDISSLARLTKLEALVLTTNQISDLSPLAGLTNLERLTLNENQISDISPLKGLTNLKELFLVDNPIPDDQKEMLRKALPNCDISF